MRPFRKAVFRKAIQFGHPPELFGQEVRYIGHVLVQSDKRSTISDIYSRFGQESPLIGHLPIEFGQISPKKPQFIELWLRR